MDNFQIEFNKEIGLWELVDVEDTRDIIDSSSSLEDILSAYPSIRVILPVGAYNKDLDYVS